MSKAIAADAVVDQVEDESVVAITKDGRVIRQIDEDELNCDIILRYQAMAAKAFKQTKGGDREIHTAHFVTASQWLMMQLFTVDHQPLKIDHVTGSPKSNPECLGLMVIAKLNQLANALVTELPTEGKD
jgi:hypothetical protein